MVSGDIDILQLTCNFISSIPSIVIIFIIFFTFY